MTSFTQFIDITGDDIPNAPLVAGGFRAYYNTGSGGVPATAAQIAAARAAGMTIVLYDQSPSLSSFAAGNSDMADVETDAGTIASVDAAIIARRAKGLTIHTVYCSLDNLASVKSSVSDPAGVWYGVADYAWSLATAEGLLEVNTDWGYCQFGDPLSNPATEVPGTTVTLASANADINVANDAWITAVTGASAPAPSPAPAPADPTEVNVSALPLVVEGDTGTAVARVQALLLANSATVDLGTTGPHKDGVDGDFGALTAAAVRAFQASFGPDGPGGTGVDAEVGPGTWSALLGL